VVGSEGAWGLILYALFMPVILFVPCPFGKSGCVNIDGDLYLESPRLYFDQLGDNWVLIVWTIVGITAIGCYNTVGVAVTKYVNAVARSLVGISNILIVWLFGIIITLSTSLDWESKNPA